MSKSIGRNEPCSCGSGKKYKKCCLPKETQPTSRPSQSRPQLIIPPPRLIVPPPPLIVPPLQAITPPPLVPSIVWNGHCWRALYNTLHYRPEKETFHEFLINVVLWTFGQKWWKHQIRMPVEQRHVVTRWKYAFSEFTRRNIEKLSETSDAQRFSGDAPGTVYALLALGYDLFCLQAKDALPEFLIEKLRSNQDFQGARYEIMVAAIMARAGFEITYLDDKAVQQKHCEFIARHKTTGIDIGVEAKSRVRPGVLNTKGEFNYTEDWRGIWQLVRTARKQKPLGLPFLIFVDVNLPPSPEVPPDKKSWLRDMFAAFDNFGAPTAEEPDPFNALFPTNFAYYYGNETGKPTRGEWAFVIPRFSETPLPNRKLIDDVVEALDRYGWVPKEV